MGKVAPLRARLEHPPRAPDDVPEGKALGDVLRAGLLAIHVLAGPGRGGGHGAVPVGTGGNEHGIDGRQVEQFAEVAVHGAAVVPGAVVDHLLDRRAPRLLDVADGRELHIGLLEEAAEVVFPAPAEADAADDDSLARRRDAVEAEGGAGTDDGGDGRGRAGGGRSPQICRRTDHQTLE